MHIYHLPLLPQQCMSLNLLQYLHHLLVEIDEALRHSSHPFASCPFVLPHTCPARGGSTGGHV